MKWTTWLTAAALGVALSTPALAQNKPIRLTFASGYPATFAWTDEQINGFLPDVNKRLEAAGSANRIQWNVAVGGTLATLPNMLDAMSTGLADVGHVVHLFEPVRLPLQNVVSAAPFGTTDPRLATKVLHEMQKTNAAMQKSWDTLGLVYLTSFSFDSYLLMSSFPIKSITDLKGRKVAAAAANLPWLDGTGAIPVSGTMGTAYNDIKSGVFDAAVNSGMLSIGGKLHEVAPHIVRTGFGAINAFDLVANKARWSKLPADVQKAIQEASDAFQTRMVERIVKETANAFAAMEKDGAKISDLSPEAQAAWAASLPNIADKWAAGLEAKGLPARQVLAEYMKRLQDGGAKPARDWTR